MFIMLLFIWLTKILSFNRNVFTWKLKYIIKALDILNELFKSQSQSQAKPDVLFLFRCHAKLFKLMVTRLFGVKRLKLYLPIDPIFNNIDDECRQILISISMGVASVWNRSKVYLRNSTWILANIVESALHASQRARHHKIAVWERGIANRYHLNCFS